MSLFGLGKKKEEVKIEPACACNGEVATYEASSCCCGGQQACWPHPASAMSGCTSIWPGACPERRAIRTTMNF